MPIPGRERQAGCQCRFHLQPANVGAFEGDYANLSYLPALPQIGCLGVWAAISSFSSLICSIPAK
jgi:hypothetical protein